MSKSLPSQTPVALRASFSSLLLSSFLQPYPFTVVRPALVNSGLASKEAFNQTYHRNELGKDHPLGVIENCLAAWVDSALGKGKAGRGRGMSGTPGVKGGLKWGEEVLGERAYDELQRFLDGTRGDTVADEPQKTSSTDRGHGDGREDEMTVVAWIVKKKRA